MRKTGAGIYLGEGGSPKDRITIHPVTLKDFSFTSQDGFLYVATRAISSRTNANLDSWPVDELKKSYKTFIGRGVFVEHQNWDPKRARGVILDSIYRQSKTSSGLPDAAVYLLLEVDAQQYPKLAKAVLNGEVTGVSMGADVAFTRCSFCGNDAKDVHEYCEHIPHLKGQVLSTIKNGRKIEGLVHEICYGHNFFEISFVFDPADESAWITDKKLYRGTKASRVSSVQPLWERRGFQKTASKVVSSVDYEYDFDRAYPRFSGNDVVLRVPHDVDTLQGEQVCPSCNEDFDGLICENCGFENPPEELSNPDLTPQDRQETVNEDQQDVQQQKQWGDQLDQQQQGGPETQGPPIQEPQMPQEDIQSQVQSGPEVQGQEFASPDQGVQYEQGQGATDEEAQQIPLTGDYDEAGQQFAEEEQEDGLQGITPDEQQQLQEFQDEENQLPDQERQRDMSRFQDLLTHSSVRQSMVPDSQYDQQSTMYLDSMGMDEDAPPATSDMGGSQQGKSRKELDPTDLNAAGSDINGGPGRPAVRAQRRPVKKVNPTQKQARLRRLAEDINELQGQAQDTSGQAADQTGQMAGGEAPPTDQGLGDVDTLLQTLDSTVDQLTMAVGEQQGMQEAGPEAGMEGGAPAPMANAPQPPVEQEQEQLPQVQMASIKRRIRRARRLVRQARRTMAQFGEEAEQMDPLINELDQEVNMLDEDVDQLDTSQDQDNQHNFQGQPEEIQAPGVTEGCGSFGDVRRSSRLARRHLHKALNHLSGDQFDDQQVDQELDQTVQETDQVVKTLEEIEGEQHQDNMGAFASKRSYKKAKARRDRQMASALRRARIIAKKATLIQSKFIMADDDSFPELQEMGGEVDHDLIELEHDVADLEGEDQGFDNGGGDFGPPQEQSGSDMDSFQGGDPGMGGGGGDQMGGGACPQCGGAGCPACGQGPEAFDHAQMASRVRANRRPTSYRGLDGKTRTRKPVATNGNQETQKWTDATDLDNHPATREQAETPDYRVDVTAPTDEGNQLRAADVPPYYNDGASAGYTFDNPPSRDQWPDDPGGYEYKKRESSKTRLLASIQLVEQMEELGLTKKADRARHVAEYERMHPAKIEGTKEMLDRLKSSGIRSGKSTRVASANPTDASLKRVPSLGRTRTASPQPTQSDIVSDDGLAFL